RTKNNSSRISNALLAGHHHISSAQLSSAQLIEPVSRLLITEMLKNIEQLRTGFELLLDSFHIFSLFAPTPDTLLGNGLALVHKRRIRGCVFSFVGVGKTFLAVMIIRKCAREFEFESFGNRFLHSGWIIDQILVADDQY